MMRLSILVAACGVLLACGQKDETTTIPAPVTPVPPAGLTPSWEQVSAIISADCAPCHNGTKEPLLTPGAAFSASQAKAELTSGSMPLPPQTITAADKATLLAYLGS